MKCATIPKSITFHPLNFSPRKQTESGRGTAVHCQAASASEVCQFHPSTDPNNTGYDAVH